jgi:undecaprenyl-diphosphatase
MVVLGIVQGLTEFLPISSSGHLILTRELMGWEVSDDIAYDVALHLGTTVAVLGFFWREWASMLRSAAAWVTGRGGIAEGGPYDARLLALLAIGSLPAAAVGFVFEDTIEDELRSPLIVGVALIVFGAILWGAERLARHRRHVGEATWVDSAVVGAAQALALIPGVSRAGVTITAGLWREFTRQDAARFSFLLSTPVIVGAGLLKIGEAASGELRGYDVWLMAVGALTAGVTGWLAIFYLLRYVNVGSYLPFVWYRFALGAFVLLWFGLRA